MMNPNLLDLFVAALIHLHSFALYSRNTMIGDDVVNSDEKAQPCHKCWPVHGSFLKSYDGSFRPSEQYPSRVVGTHHRKRHTSSNNQVLIKPRDGPLDSDSTYTAYLDAVGKKPNSNI